MKVPALLILNLKQNFKNNQQIDILNNILKVFFMNNDRNFEFTKKSIIIRKKCNALCNNVINIQTDVRNIAI